MSTTARYSIRDLEKLSGIKAHTIRIWEKRYDIIKPSRTNANIRFYSNDDLRHILNISLLNKNGYKISAIAGMSDADIAGHMSTVTLTGDGTEAVQENLLLSLIEMNEAMFNHAFMSILLKMGFEKAFINVIFPFFEKIGVMWQTGSINPAQEHFFSNLIRQKIIAATDAVKTSEFGAGQLVLLLLPENELHEIGLLFYNYAFKIRGYRTIYLGQSVPLESLPLVAETCKPDVVVTGMTTSLNALSLPDYAHLLRKALPGIPVYFTGRLITGKISDFGKNFYSVADLVSLLQKSAA
ncbi:MerR family transcriptional regulator [Mucilaginibacter terrenus]|uniref:MerR family transcriptional regulator n=1 Tax=Mucilaginibacter terrenus TaxID=2482727 RepID=A0A3E2NXV8_9SPHI|nr:MerR family transcriptional regulator [Mucilaginibacter terrenus]RFZ85833.1 MerR family transcriptional regulator [Mucilaginibacter terrenus]